MTHMMQIMSNKYRLFEKMFWNNTKLKKNKKHRIIANMK